MTFGSIHSPGLTTSRSDSANPTLWDGLIGAWSPILGPSGSVIRDYSGYGNHGDLTNTTPEISVFRRYVYLTGNDDIPTGLNSSEVLETGQPWSVLLYKKYISTPGGNRFAFGSSSGTPRFYVMLHNGVRYFWGWGNKNGLSNTGAPVRQGKWSQLVLTYDQANDFIWYVDGKFSGQESYTGNGQFANAEIEISREASSNGLTHLIADARLYGRALRASEVALMWSDPLASYRRRRQVFSYSSSSAPTLFAQQQVVSVI